MNNLFSFGCSLTYGYGFEDNWDSNNNRPFDFFPSKKAWPFLLANMLNYNCVNLGQCGASNKEILYILEQNIDRILIDDLVVIKWSFADRIGFKDKDSTSERVGKNFTTHSQVGDNKKWLQWLEDFSTPEDNLWISRIFIDYATLLLRQKNITQYHFYSCIDIKNLDFKFAKLENVEGDRHRLMKFPSAPFCKEHPGEEAQYFLANTKFKLIEKNANTNSRR
tara:strand:- start:2375 stop:3040 length:666 start_codon:yes stop_codon:yes gene_type:complete